MTYELRKGPRLVVALILMTALAVLSACQTPPSPPAQATPATPTPPASPSPRPALPATPTPQPSPQVDEQRPLVVEFARAQAALEREWETFQTSYQGWRQKRDHSERAMERKLTDTVASFQPIRKQAQELPATDLTRPVAARLLEAANAEESALREMRDSWKPGDIASFQKYEKNRPSVDKVRQEAAGKLSQMAAAGEPANAKALAQFSQAFKNIAARWDKLHQDYDAWRQKADRGSLDEFVTRFQGILNDIYGTPQPSVARSLAQQWTEAAEKEEAALRKLRDSPADESQLQGYEQQRLASEKARRQVSKDMEDLTASGLAENKAALDTFSASFRKIAREWDDFNSRYDSWRNEGIADKEVIDKELSGLVQSLGGVVQRAYQLPQYSLVRPLAELDIEAAEREQQALKKLSQTWKPYDSSYFNTYEQERLAVNRLRRQASAGLADLLLKYRIPAEEVKR